MRRESQLKYRQLLEDMGREVYEARTAAGLSLRGVSKETGIPHTTIHRFELGGECLASHFLILMDWLDDAVPDSMEESA